MNMKHYETAMKILLGEKVSTEDLKAFRMHEAKYQIVRELYLEHQRINGKELSNFHFTPGDNFDEISTYEILKTLIEMDLSKAKEIKFGDYNMRKTS